ncbi:MAG: S9 family peptidase [Granulosicoccus sp.]
MRRLLALSTTDKNAGMKNKAVETVEPVADIRPVTTQAFGHTLLDNYAWLRAENWQECMREPELLPADIRAYLEAENAFCEAGLSDTNDLQRELKAELRGRIEERNESLPDADGPWMYGWQYAEGDEYPLYWRHPRKGGEKHILLDENLQSRGHEYFDTGDFVVSPDHRHAAWTVDTQGSEYYRLLVRDLATGVDGDAIEDVEDVAWIDDKTLLYTRVDENHRPSKVYRHVLGTSTDADVLVHDEHDARFFCSVWRSRSGCYAFIGSSMNDVDEVHFIPVNDPGATPILIEARTDKLEYSVEHQGDRFLILTNADDATDFRIVETPVTTPGRGFWADVVPPKAGRMLLSVDAYDDWLLWMERENALPRICYRGADGVTQELAFDEEAYSLWLEPGLEPDAHTTRFGYSSPTTPDQTFDLNLMSGERRLLKQQKIPSGHDPADYITRRIAAQSADGAEVPVTLLYHRNTVIDASAPCLLYGYGAYGDSQPAAFSSRCLSLVDRGFVYAIAHVRGGDEKGRAWYEAAKFDRKPSSFHDFIAAGEKLIEDRYTANGRIVIHGASAGGLLVGASLNMQPSLWGGVIADVPFVDVLNTMLDDTLPLTPGEWSQWGNPLDSKAAFETMLAYSPYEQVTECDYPPILVTAGVSDPRVTYWEPAKWVAKIRACRSNHELLLLKTNLHSGHFGETGRFAELDDTALYQAFAIKIMDLSKGKSEV